MKKLLFISIWLIAATACNVTKRLPPGEKLYTGATVKVESDSLSKSTKGDIKTDLKTFVRPKPNSSILGIKFKLWVWQVVGEPKKPKGIRNWLRNKLGEPPVLASSVNLERNLNLLNSRMENKGYFQSAGTADSVIKGKTMHAEYTVRPGDQYLVKKLVIPADSSTTVGKFIKQSAVRRNTKNANGTRSLIKVGKPYDLDVFITERERIDNYLKQRGFYYFNPDYIKMRVDSTVGEKKVDVFVTVKNETPSVAEKQYYIDKVFIYPNYTLSPDSVKSDSTGVLYISKKDSNNQFYVVDPEKNYKPQVFERAMLFQKHDLYNRDDHNLSLNRLVNIGTFKFVKNRFEISPQSTADSAKLDVYYYLTPQKRKSIRTELTGKTNTAGFTGTELEINWRNRNTFRGAELLTLKAYGGVDFQIAGQNKGYNVYRLGGEGNITWPRIFPINFKSAGAFVPRTKFTLGYDWQKREKLYTLNTFRTSYGFLWKESEKKEHELNPLNITYVLSSNVTDEYQQQINDDITGTLARVIDKQLIIGPTYSFTYNNSVTRPKPNKILYTGKLDLSGNLIGLISGAKPSNPKTIFGVQYSQYVKTEQDLRYYRRIGRKANGTEWANRLFVGYSIPYGNSNQLPFIKQFFSGGPNGLRGFRVRTLGPGTYRAVVNPNSFFPDQTGDIKLEFNSEMRVKVVSILNAAFFVDAGNIWLKNNNDLKAGAKFTSSFMKELAADAGLGLRFDLSILVLRLDLAMPIRKPWLPDGQRWVLSDIDFGNSAWRKENLVLNIAIGMPF